MTTTTEQATCERDDYGRPIRYEVLVDNRRMYCGPKILADDYARRYLAKWGSLYAVRVERA